MKNTSIEWLFNLTNEGYWDSLDDASKQKALKLAMDMYKEEMINFAHQCSVSYKHEIAQKFNETYGGNK